MLKMTSEINGMHLQDQNHNTLLSGATRLDCQVAGHSAKKGRALGKSVKPGPENFLII